MPRRMRLFAWLSSGAAPYHSGNWRHPASEIPALEPQSIVRLTQLLERAKFDGVFFADGLSGPSGANEGSGIGGAIDPIPLAAMLAQATSRIGIGVTANVQYLPTYTLARLLGSLDYLSGGRIAWNVVAGYTDRAPALFGHPGVLDRGARYALAAETVAACRRLWDSFPAEAITADRDSGRFHDLSRIDRFEFHGDRVRTAGPLDTVSSRQRGPVIMQAGASEAGKQFAAEHAEIVFAMLASPEEIAGFTTEMRERLADVGRSERCLIVPLVTVISAGTDRAAREIRAELDELLDPSEALASASHLLGVDLTAYDPATPAVSVLDTPAIRALDRGSVGLRELALQIARQRGLGIGAAAVRMVNAGVPEIIGSHALVAEELEALFHSTGADGFMLHAPILPRTFASFAANVVPLLQQRGVLQREYGSDTLRGGLFGE